MVAQPGKGQRMQIEYNKRSDNQVLHNCQVKLPLMIISLFLTLIAAGVSLCTVFGFLGRWWWRFDLFGHFRTQYVVLLGIVILALAFQGEWLLVGIFGLFEGINFYLIAPFYGPLAPALAEKTHRLLLANVLQENQHYHKMLNVIESTQPDFVGLIETGEHWIEALGPLQKLYPHCIHEFWGEENYDIALFSRVPPDSLEVQHLGPVGVPTIVGRFTLEDGALTLIITHPPPPKTRRETEARNAQLIALAEFAANQPGRVILTGDLNITSWSPFFAPLLQRGKLSDSRLRRGIQPSWPVNSPLLRIPIDHVLVSSGVQVHRRFLGPPTGSDHRPVLMDFK
jgi:endonuclease/exonuclease/phosphatase (EEP) superfamily protein YafD